MATSQDEDMVYFIKGIAVSSVSKCLQKDEHKNSEHRPKTTGDFFSPLANPSKRDLKTLSQKTQVSPLTGTKYSEGHIVMHRLGGHSLLASQTRMGEHVPLFVCFFSFFFLMCAMLLLTRLAVFLN